MVLAVAALAVGAFIAGRAAVARPTSPVISDLARFTPASISFPSAGRGWALGTGPCNTKQRCLGLLETRNGGRTWSVRPLPASLLPPAAAAASRLQVRFADARNGWIYGSLDSDSADAMPALWSTHDGGATWRSQPLPWAARTVYDLESSDGTVQLMAPTPTGDVAVMSSPVTRDAWHRTSALRLGEPAGGAEPTGAFTLLGASGWLVEGNDRGTTGSARLTDRGTWVRWSTPPCSTVGGSYAVPAAATTRDLVAICVIGGYASPLPKAAPPGATLGSSWLYFSTDGGTTFTAGPPLRPAMGFAGSELLAAPTPEALFVDRLTAGGGVLAASFDGGRSWTTVYPVDTTFLSFSSPLDAVGLAGSTTATTRMIVSRDGGRIWTRVAF